MLRYYNSVNKYAVLSQKGYVSRKEKTSRTIELASLLNISYLFEACSNSHLGIPPSAMPSLFNIHSE